MSYQAKIRWPFGVLGIRCNASALTGIEFLPASAGVQSAVDPLTQEVCKQLQCYFENPRYQFSLPIHLPGSPHQQKVWRALQAIACGNTRTYGDLALECNSCAQAVGQACGANPIPIVIPCHRVVSKAGLGGFMHHASGGVLDIKRWLLAHEQQR